MPDFRLPNASGEVFAASDFGDAKALLVVFWCNHCPYVRHIKRAFAAFAAEWLDKGLATVAINSNDIEAYPSDAPNKMLEDVADFSYGFPYLVDADQSVGRAFDAACTPDFFLYGPDRTLAYRGQFDSARPYNDVPSTGESLSRAVGELLAGEPISQEQIPSLGCGIKWRGGD